MSKMEVTWIRVGEQVYKPNNMVKKITASYKDGLWEIDFLGDNNWLMGRLNTTGLVVAYKEFSQSIASSPPEELILNSNQVRR